jgi:hypothetical protein
MEPTISLTKPGTMKITGDKNKKARENNQANPHVPQPCVLCDSQRHAMNLCPTIQELTKLLRPPKEVPLLPTTTAMVTSAAPSK